MQVNADLVQQRHRQAEPHSHSHEEHSHAHHSHAEHSETHTQSEQSDSHSAHSHSHDHHHEHDDHVHDDSVSSVSVKLDGSMNVQSVNAFLGHIISMNPENMYRYKGIVAIAGTDDRVVFQVSVSALALSRLHDTQKPIWLGILRLTSSTCAVAVMGELCSLSCSDLTSD